MALLKQLKERFQKWQGGYSVTSKYRGHPIAQENSGEWVFIDTRESVQEAGDERPCGKCGIPGSNTHDFCLGTLPGVLNACCGHGNSSESYIMFENGLTIRGFDRIER